MSLRDDILALRQSTMGSLTEAHDYYIHTRGLWRLLHIAVVREGRTFTIRNRETGTVVDESILLVLAQSFATRRVAASALQEWVSIFESFVIDLIRLWLRAYPQSLEKNQLVFADVLGADDKATLVNMMVDKQVDGIRYKRLAEWCSYLNSLVKLDCPDADEVQRLAEIKASRDIFMHNSGVANSVYVDKSGTCAKYGIGQPLDLPPSYLRESWLLMRKLFPTFRTPQLQKLELGCPRGLWRFRRWEGSTPVFLVVIVRRFRLGLDPAMAA